jgi:hypothetical protein
MIDLFVDLSPFLDPFSEDAAIFVHRAVEPNISVLLPFSLLHDLRRVQLMGEEFRAKAELARDNLVECKYHELDVVAVLFVLKLAPVVLVSLPA